MVMTHYSLDHIRVLEALLRTRSPSSAAHELGVTQSAVSKTLAQLRTRLADELLVRRGDRMILTPRAQRLANPLGASLNTLYKLLEEDSARPRPSVAAVSMRDQFVLALAPALLRRLTHDSPETTLNIVPYERERLADDLARGTVDVAVAVDPPDVPGLIAKTLYHETFVCLTPHRSPPTLAQYLDARHVATTSHTGYSGIDAALARKGYRRRITSHVPYFAALVHVAEAEGLYATLPRRVVEAMPPRNAFVHALPVAIPGFRVSMIWHRRCQHDLDNQWLRDLLVAAAKLPQGR
jgi:DNA-binding transcriptional LysR family regulator